MLCCFPPPIFRVSSSVFLARRRVAALSLNSFWVEVSRTSLVPPLSTGLFLDGTHLNRTTHERRSVRCECSLFYMVENAFLISISPGGCVVPICVDPAESAAVQWELELAEFRGAGGSGDSCGHCRP